MTRWKRRYKGVWDRTEASRAEVRPSGPPGEIDAIRERIESLTAETSRDRADRGDRVSLLDQFIAACADHKIQFSRLMPSGNFHIQFGAEPRTPIGRGEYSRIRVALMDPKYRQFTGRGDDFRALVSEACRTREVSAPLEVDGVEDSLEATIASLPHGRYRVPDLIQASGALPRTMTPELADDLVCRWWCRQTSPTHL